MGWDGIGWLGLRDVPFWLVVSQIMIYCNNKIWKIGMDGWVLIPTLTKLHSFVPSCVGCISQLHCVTCEVTYFVWKFSQKVTNGDSLNL